MLGRLLRNVRAGEQHLLVNDPAVRDTPSAIVVESPAFPSGGKMPVGNISPPLRWSNVPRGAAELLLVMEDPDVPLKRPAVHLIATAIPAAMAALDRGALTAANPAGIRLGRVTLGRIGYFGPGPLPGHGPHHYVFQLLALRTRLAFDHSPTRAEVVAALPGNVLAHGRLEGVLER